MLGRLQAATRREGVAGHEARGHDGEVANTRKVLFDGATPKRFGCPSYLARP